MCYPIDQPLFFFHFHFHNCSMNAFSNFPTLHAPDENNCCSSFTFTITPHSLSPIFLLLGCWPSHLMKMTIVPLSLSQLHLVRTTTVPLFHFHSHNCSTIIFANIPCACFVWVSSPSLRHLVRTTTLPLFHFHFLNCSTTICANFTHSFCLSVHQVYGTWWERPLFQPRPSCTLPPAWNKRQSYRI